MRNLSIIIPSYNQVEFLPDCIESVLQQSGRVGEIIIVDDGSTDGSLDVARNYESKFLDIKVISQVNKGLASARNTGIMNAKFDWILPLDADDMLLENAIERLDEEIDNQGKEFDIIAPSFRTFGIQGQEVVLYNNPTINEFKSGNRIGYFSAIRRSKLLEVGGYSPKMVEGYEDLHLSVNLLERGAKIFTLKDVLVLYRVKETSMLTEAKKHHQKLLDQINKDFPEAKLNF